MDEVKLEFDDDALYSIAKKQKKRKSEQGHCVLSSKIYA